MTTSSAKNGEGCFIKSSRILPMEQPNDVACFYRAFTTRLAGPA
jgi:hypothetical protein